VGCIRVILGVWIWLGGLDGMGGCVDGGVLVCGWLGAMFEDCCRWLLTHDVKSFCV